MASHTVRREIVRRVGVPPDHARRHADESLERPAEGRLRSVAEAERELAERGSILMQPRLCGSVAVEWAVHSAATKPAADPLTRAVIQPYGCIVKIAPPDFDRMFGALADSTRRDIVRRAIDAREGVAELASHYPMSFSAVQKHIAILERAGLVTKRRIGRRKVVRANVEVLRAARRLLDRYEELWRARIDRMTAIVAEDP